MTPIEFQDSHKSFTARLLLCNRIDVETFHSWLVKPGMGYNEQHKWWGDLAGRPVPHEGVDILFYTDTLGRERQLPVGTMIPSLESGRLVRIMPDLVAQTIIIHHNIHDDSGGVLHTFYAHIEPNELLSVADEISEETIIGHIAKPKNITDCPPHLHFSAAWIKPETSVATLSWPEFTTNGNVTGFDPLSLISS